MCVCACLLGVSAVVGVSGCKVVTLCSCLDLGVDFIFISCADY